MAGERVEAGQRRCTGGATAGCARTKEHHDDDERGDGELEGLQKTQGVSRGSGSPSALGKQQLNTHTSAPVVEVGERLGQHVAHDMEVAHEGLRAVRAIARVSGAAGVRRRLSIGIELTCEASVAAAASVGGFVVARPLRMTSAAGSVAGSSAVLFDAALATALLLTLLPSDATGIRDGSDRVGVAEGCGVVASRASVPIAACSSLLASDRRVPTSAALAAAPAISERAGALTM